MTITGYIYEYDGETLTIVAPFSDGYLLDKQQITECEIHLDDGRRISAKQRNKIFAMVNDIADFVRGRMGKRYYEETLREMQLLYIYDATDNESIRRQLTLNYCNLCNREVFSLKDIDMSTARDFIDWLVELCIVHDIPCNDTLLNRCEDTSRYLYLCIAMKKCAVCGRKGDLHHVDAVGMGRDRTSIIHEGMKAICLCRKHHNELHRVGKKTFCNKYYVYGIKLDKHLCELLKLKGRLT